MSAVSKLTIDGAQLNASLSAVDAEVNEPVQIKLLAWVMSLPADLDPAVAAQLVMRHRSVEQTRDSVAEHTVSRALMRLVEVVAQYPHERLMALTSRRRKRAVH